MIIIIIHAKFLDNSGYPTRVNMVTLYIQKGDTLTEVVQQFERIFKKHETKGIKNTTVQPPRVIEKLGQTSQETASTHLTDIN